MKRLLMLVLLSVVGLSGCFWGVRGPRRDEGHYRRDDRREHDERGRHEEDRGRDYEHR
jgi:hypothetical protein